MPETQPNFDTLKLLEERYQEGFKIIGHAGLAQIQDSVSSITDVSARVLFAKVLVARLAGHVTPSEVPAMITNARESLYSDLNVDIYNGPDTNAMKSVTARDIIMYLTRGGNIE